MNTPKKLLVTMVAAVAVLIGIAATSVPSMKMSTWEYRVVKETVNVSGPLTATLNNAARSGWTIDTFSTHSTGNAEVGVVILKRQVQVEVESPKK